MRLVDLTVVSRRVVVALSKPSSMERSLNVTLHIEGTDVAQPARWSVLNASSVLERSPWLQLPIVAGFSNDTGATVSGAYTEIHMPLTLSAASLCERAA
eukprot:2707977-Prymnesium_polylepis.1